MLHHDIHRLVLVIVALLLLCAVGFGLARSQWG
jgi:hypothetical protein